MTIYRIHTPERERFVTSARKAVHVVLQAGPAQTLTGDRVEPCGESDGILALSHALRGGAVLACPEADVFAAAVEVE